MQKKKNQCHAQPSGTGKMCRKNKEKNLKLLGSCFPTVFFFFPTWTQMSRQTTNFLIVGTFHITSQKIVEAKIPPFLNHTIMNRACTIQHTHCMHDHNTILLNKQYTKHYSTLSADVEFKNYFKLSQSNWILFNLWLFSKNVQCGMMHKNRSDKLSS